MHSSTFKAFVRTYDKDEDESHTDVISAGVAESGSLKIKYHSGMIHVYARGVWKYFFTLEK